MTVNRYFQIFEDSLTWSIANKRTFPVAVATITEAGVNVILNMFILTKYSQM